MDNETQSSKDPESREVYWTNPKKRLLTIALLLALAILSGTALVDRPLRGIDERASLYLNRTMLKAGVTFAVARGLNGIISVIQESRIGFDLFVSGDLALFELLDPVNDLIEKFSTVMLISTVSLGIQKLLMEIGRWLGISILLTASLLLFIIGTVLPDRFVDTRKKINSFSFRILIIAIVIRVCIPIIALVGSGINTIFLEKKYEVASGFIENAYEQGEKVSSILNYLDFGPEERPTSGGEGRNKRELEGDRVSFFRLFRMRDVREAPQTEKNGGYTTVPLSLKNIFGTLVERLKEISSHVIDLIVIFLIQTILIPLVTFWGLVWGVKLLFGRTFRPQQRVDEYVKKYAFFS